MIFGGTWLEYAPLYFLGASALVCLVLAPWRKA